MLSIFGGCVTRDIFRLTETDELVDNLWARMTIPSAMSRPIPSLMYPEDFTPPNFESRQSFIDANKLLLDQLDTQRPKILLIDFMSEIYYLGLAEGGMVTLADQTAKRKVELDLDVDLIAPFSSERIPLMTRFLPQFMERLQSGYDTAVYVHEIYQSEKMADERGNLTRFPESDLAEIRKANNHLKAIYDVVRSMTPSARFFQGDPELAVADKNHAWGISPFHFLSDYSRSAFQRLDEVIGLLAPEATS